MHLYPNVGFDKTKFYILPGIFSSIFSFLFVSFCSFCSILFLFVNIIYVAAKYWQEGRSIKKFFDEFAQKKGFDPLIAKNWYLVSVAEILAAHKVSPFAFFSLLIYLY